MGKRRAATGDGLDHITADLRPLAVPMAGLTLDPANANKHPEASLVAICSSLRTFGQRKPIVVNVATGVIEAGNGTFVAAQRLGWTMIAAVRVEDDPATQTGFAIADNRSAQFAEWDDEQLALQLETIEEEFSDLYLDLQLADLLDSPEELPLDSEGVAVPENYGVLISCQGEKDQREMYERLQKLGIACKVITM